jgi:outer membrane lipoprotein-sorting protein
MKAFLFCILWILLWPGQAPAEEPAAGASIKLHSVQADFLQEKNLKILARPIISSGTFTFQSPHSLRWEYREPIASILLMHGGKVRKFVAVNGELVEDGRVRLDAMQVVLAEISNWFAGRFTDNAIFSVSFADEKTIKLTPKEQGLASLISRIELKLANQAGLLEAVTIYEGSDSSTKLTFSNGILNQEIPAAVFTKK